ncbi:MAG TPA: cysteine-rich CWC family protein [Burkholderiales bacterium]
MAADARAACARCGTVFLCGMQAAGENSAPCWCAGLPPLRPLPGRGCLCRECLEFELAQRRAPG